MPTVININTLNGQFPFDVYTCDTGYTTCIYVSTINGSDIPYEFTIPSVQQGMTSIGLKVVDDTGCVIQQNLTI